MKISAIIIAKNEEVKIEDCLQSLHWTDEIVFVDTGSTDNTLEIARKYNCVIHKFRGGNFNDWRNEGLKHAKGEWVLYVDADERVTPLLRKEITHLINGETNQFAVYAIPRRNFILGREMRHGGWWPDYVKRLYRRLSLKKWIGKLHEEPVYEGSIGHLSNPIVHLKHDNLSEMVDKTNKWSKVEADLLFKANHPKMAWWRFFRIMFGELWLRLVKNKGFLDGPEGVIYSFYQSWSRFMTYAKLWEKQLKTESVKNKIEKKHSTFNLKL